MASVAPLMEARAGSGRFVPDAATRLLVVAPHPDDETIANGELIQHVAAAGGEVAVLLLTDGDDNPWPQRWLERRLWIGPGDRRRWGQRRRGEVTEALQRLGVDHGALHPLGWPDMGLADGLRRQPMAMADTVRGWLQAFDPNVIALPALDDRHPDHGSAHVLTRLAVADWDRSPLLMSYLVHGHGTRAAPTMDVPPGAHLHGAKLHALEAHRSQTALSGGRMRRMTDRPERHARIGGAGETLATGLLPWRPAPACWPWLRLSVVDRHGARSWAWRDAPVTRTADGAWMLAEPSPSAPAFARLECTVPTPWIFDRWGWCEL